MIGWSPDTFWAATPRELAAALEGRFGEARPPVDRASLARLMTLFPDTPAPIRLEAAP